MCALRPEEGIRSLELALQRVVRSNVGPEIQTWLLFKSSKYSLLKSQLFSPLS